MEVIRNEYGFIIKRIEIRCLNCGWEWEQGDLLSDNWDDYRYCPNCNDDNLKE